MALLLTAALLAGCTVADLSHYPYASQEHSIPRTRLTLAVPQEEWTVALCGQLSELVAERSGGAVSLQFTPAEDPMELYRSGEADMVLCTTDEIIQLDDSLGWLSLPFLFQSPGEYLTATNEEQSLVRTSEALRAASGGSVVGTYYDCGWMLASTAAAQETSPLTGILFGSDYRFSSGELFNGLSARDTATGNAKKLWQLFSQGEAATVEFRPDETENLPGGTSFVTISRHRIEARFLLLRDGVLEGDALLCLTQAVSETVGQASHQRMQEEESRLEALCGAANANLITQRPSELFKRAVWIYQTSSSAYALSTETLKFLMPFLISS